MKTQSIHCPSGHGNMTLKQFVRETDFRGVELKYPTEAFICETCGLEAGTIEQGAAEQRALADAYKNAKGLLTGDEIKSLRQKAAITQQELANRIGVGVASIKRWEKGLIQTEANDNALRRMLQGPSIENVYTGNRELSIPRIKLVINAFEKAIGIILLTSDDNDKLLYSAKYVFYADMLAYKRLGRSMTGATYAALPMGPQLNNYADLVDAIKKADESVEDPLTDEEIAIIKAIARAYPTPASVYHASHREMVWKKRTTGAIIPYTDAMQLTQI